MTADEEIAALRAEVAVLKQGQVDYRDPTAPLDARIAAAEAAGDVTWSVPLKVQRSRDMETDATVLDFRRDDDGSTLREEIAAADAAGNIDELIALKQQLGTALRDHAQTGEVERLDGIKSGIGAVIEQRQAEAAARSGTSWPRQEPGGTAGPVKR